jgi:hypothetical protein
MKGNKMSYNTNELIQEIDGTIHWRNEVLERYPEDIRNRIAMYRLEHLKQQLEIIESSELDRVLAAYHEQEVEDFSDEPITSQLLKEIGFSWNPTIKEFVQLIISMLQPKGRESIPAHV